MRKPVMRAPNSLLGRVYHKSRTYVTALGGRTSQVLRMTSFVSWRAGTRRTVANGEG